MNDTKLINAAASALKNAYAPYSGFLVGAALLTKSGRVFCGCNIENAAYPAGICAERVALGSAVAAGEREFAKIAVVGGRDGIISDFCAPCGICRQALSELCDPDFEILLSCGAEIKKYRLAELLPENFGRNNLCE